MPHPETRAWSAQDDIDLLTSIETGSSIRDIATRLGRREADCRARLAEITEAAGSIFPRETAAS